jgi:hypothetical protein
MKYYIKDFKILVKKEVKPTWTDWVFRLFIPGLPKYEYHVWIKTYRPVEENTLIRLDNGCVFVVVRCQALTIKGEVVYILYAETLNDLVDDLVGYKPELFHIWNPSRTEI